MMLWPICCAASANRVIDVACYELPPFFMNVENGMLTSGAGVARLSAVFDELSRGPRVFASKYCKNLCSPRHSWPVEDY